MEILPLGYHKVRHVFTCAGIIDEMGFGYALAPHGDGNEAAATAELADEIFQANGVWNTATMSSSYTYQRVEDTQMLEGGPYTAIWDVGIAGTGVVDVLPPNCAQLIRKVTNAGGRQNRGRMYFPPFRLFEVNVTSSGVLAPATLTTVNTALNAWYAGLVAGLSQPMLLHSDPLEDPTPIIGFQAMSLIATQRRRLR